MSELKLTKEFALQFLVSVYLTLIVLSGILGFFSTELTFSSPFMIGEATSKGIDVSSRISIFYMFVVIGMASFVFFYLLVSRFLTKFFNGLTRKKELQTLIVFQIILCIFNCFSDQKVISDSLFHLSIAALFVVELKESFSKKTYTLLLDDNLKSLFIVALSLFLITENIFITATVLVVLIPLLSINRIQKSFNGVALVLTALPVMLFLTVETTLILNQNSFYSVNYWSVGILLLFILVLLVFLLKINSKEISKVIYNWQAPLVILGTAIFVTYTPVYSSDNSLFELANNMNPLMMSEVHHSVYFVDYISSHLISDFIWMKLYVIFNGYQNEMAPLIYYGFSWVCYTITIFYFLKEYFKQHFGILLFMLFTPYLFFYFPHSYAFALIPVIYLHRYITTKENRHLWWFGITSTLTVFWRLDLGVAVVGASLIVFGLLFLLEKNARKALLKIGVSLALFYGVLFVIYYSFCNELIKEALHYFGGSQGHGVSELTREYSNLFYFDYFILPVLIGLCALFLLIQCKSLKGERFYWPILFFIGFYFLNFQRGLVRHSFMEMNETYISSFGWIILAFLFYELFRKNLSLRLFGILMIGGFFLSIHTVEKSVSIVDRKKGFSINHLPKLKGKKIDRSPENYDYGRYTKPVVQFLRKSLKGDETFFDFSNSPMLYYKTEKKIPAYFSQSLQYIVDLHLQNECIKNLKKHSIPLVVFNQTVNSFGDNIDDIPNKVRYHYIASYLIDNYIPSNDYGLFHIWKQKNNSDFDTSFHTVQSEIWNLGLIPMYWKANKNEPIFKLKRKVSLTGNKAKLGKIEGGDFIQLKVNAEKDAELKMWLKIDNETNFYVNIDVKEGIYEYKFPLCGSYYIRKEKNPTLEFEIDQRSTLLNIKIVNQSY